MDVFNLTQEELTEFIVSQGEKKFRAKQVYEWLHEHVITSYDDMHNVPKKLRQALGDNYPLQELEIEEVQESSDGTKKFLFKCTDGAFVESVLIPNDDGRLTACISTQVGCAMQCAFCATGMQGFKRNLEAQEIVFQVDHMCKHANERIDNVVVMGQGEPFLNYDATLAAIKRLNHDAAHNIASRKITVSTCGINEGIQRFSEEAEQFGLAVSLHSAVHQTRDELMPKMQKVPLESLSAALSTYQQVTNRRITFEYMLLDSVNDSPADLEALVKFCKPFMCHVNLLHFNEVDCCEFKPSELSKFKMFEGQLSAAGIACSERKSKGSDVDGACGQLSNKHSL